MPQQIAFFDFDGTITTKDSLLELARFHKGPFGYAKGMIILSPTLLAFKLGKVDAKKAKEKFIRFFLQVCLFKTLKRYAANSVHKN